MLKSNSRMAAAGTAIAIATSATAVLLLGGGSAAAGATTPIAPANSVTGSSVKDGTLWASDLAPSVVKWFTAPGPQGKQGIQGLPGKDGTNGTNGKDGTNGTNGTNGTDGKSAYDLAKANDPTIGTEAEWLKSLNGTNGVDGKDGAPGAPGADGKDSTVPGPQGPAGADGKDGAKGDSYLTGAYYSVAYYDKGDTNAGAIATVKCKAQTDTAISGGAQVLGLDATANSRNTPVSSSFPGRMDWTTNTPIPNRLDGWVIQFGGGAIAPEKVKVWALCAPGLNLPVEQTYVQSQG
jgi:hypothetical protein